ncbi:ras-related protein Rab-44 isoform X3 [Anser cygnoides]|uniref:ras-related protein Rab-44 isoform X3 n=1 Tax=Anser cygnoides TaxID=8845 RepID=UPI0034D2E6FF
MAEHRAGAKGRRMGSSRRRQLCKDPGPSEEPPWASKVMQRVQDFIQGHHKDQTGFITRSDMQKLQEKDFPCSTEELELLFDGLDAAGTGRLNTEEFVAGLWQFLSSQKASRDHRQRKTASRRNSVLASPLLEGVDSEEQKHFAAFMDQLGTDDISEEQEIWQLWAKLRKDEPQLLGNLEDFLAKMRHRIQEARSKKEALEVTLNKCMAEHNLEVQRLCAAMEQQIQQEKQRLEQEVPVLLLPLQSMARSHLHGMELQRVLDASEREVQRLVAEQVELETRCHSLRSMQQVASTEKQQLEESNRVLEEQLQHINLQLQQTHGCLRTTWAAVAQEHTEELQDRAVAELPGETPPSLQMSPEQSEKYCSEMQIRLGSRAGKPQRKNTHQVVWEKLPAETSISGLPRALSVEEDPFPEFLKEEQFSDQGSLLREMNDAIAALSVQLMPQAPAAPTALAEAACCLQDDAEPQTGPEAAALHGSAIGAPQDTHVGNKLFKVDLREGRTAAELPARDMTQAGASTEELGAEQGNSLEGAGQGLEEVQGTLLGKGKGADEKEQMLKEAERPQGAPRESTEIAEQAWVEVEGAEWVHKKTEQEKAQPPEDAEEAVLSQGENLEATPEGWELELAPGWGFARDVLGVPGGSLEPELTCRGEVQMAAKREDGVLPGVTTVPNPENVDGEGDGAEVQSWGQDKGTAQVDADPAQVHGAKHGRSHGAACELPSEAAEEERGAGEAMQGGQCDAGLQPSGEDFGDMKEGTAHAHVLQLEAVPQAETQEGAVEADVQQLEALSSAACVQLPAEMGELQASSGGSLAAELQLRSVAGAPGTEQAGSVGPEVQPLEEDGRAEPGLEERTSAAAALGEGLAPAETPIGSLGLARLVLINAQTLGMEEAEGSPAETLLHGGPIPEASRDVGHHMDMHLREEAEDGGQGPSKPGLPNQPLLDPQGAEAGLAEGAASEVPPQEKAGSMEVLEVLSSAASVQLLAELGELEASSGGSTAAELQHRSVAGAPGTEQAGSVWPDVQPLEEAGRAEPGLEERTSAAAALDEGLSPAETPAGSPVPDGLVQDNAQELKLKEAESPVQVEELLPTPGGSTWADLQPLFAAGTGEVTQSQAVALEAGLCTVHNRDAWDGDADALVPLPAVAALHHEYASATAHPYPDVILVALNDPDEQVLEENQALEIFQEESGDAEGRPLDGAQGLEVVQGATLEAETRILAEVQHLELKQGHDTNAATLASPVSEVPLPISTLNWDTVMQEDVLIPDVQWLGGSGQAAQSELLEQVSSQADKVRLHAAPQQPQEKPPCVTETERVAAGPAEPPKQEVPPVSAFCTRVQEEEDTGNDLLGMNLRDSTLVDAANGRVQPQRHLSEEWREDLDVGQPEKKKEIGQKMSQEGEPSPGEPGAMTVNGAGASPRGPSEVSLDPDYLYNVLFVGDSHVGKTSFLYRLHANTFNPHLTATVGLDYQVKSLIVDNKHFALRLWDSAGQERYHSITKQFFRKADGVVLMYDITSQYSFADVRYWLSCIQEGAEDGVTILLLGNKTDCATERQVPTQEAERLAEEYQLIFYECSAASGHNVAESMVSLIRSLKVREDQLRNKAEEVSKLPQKKKGCCW